jgi:hypothetical protein
VRPSPIALGSQKIWVILLLGFQPDIATSGLLGLP